MDQYLLIPFLVGWTSINPSYFDVNYRGTIGFDTLPIVFKPLGPGDTWGEAVSQLIYKSFELQWTSNHFSVCFVLAIYFLGYEKPNFDPNPWYIICTYNIHIYMYIYIYISIKYAIVYLNIYPYTRRNIYSYTSIFYILYYIYSILYNEHDFPLSISIPDCPSTIELG